MDFNTTEELIPEKASLLNIANFTSEVYTDKLADYYPEQSMVENIIKDDNGKLKLDPKMEDAIRVLEESGNAAMAATLRAQNTSHKNKDRSFHYLPYRTDSDFEQSFLKGVLSFAEIENLGLEVYYNGDRIIDYDLSKFHNVDLTDGNDLIRYLNVEIPDFPSIILTSFAEDSRNENTVINALILDRDVMTSDVDGEEYSKFIETITNLINVFKKRLQLNLDEYKILIAKRQNQLLLSPIEEQRLITLYRRTNVRPFL